MVMTVEERKAYNKAYHKANRDKILAYNKAYREANKEKVSITNKVSGKKYYAKNKEALKIKRAKYLNENKVKISCIKKEWRINNRAILNAIEAKNRATKFKATIYMTKDDKAKIAELYTIAKDASKLFGYNWEVDHIVPLTKGGLHKLSNLQVVPMSWNRSKNNRNCDTYWD